MMGLPRIGITCYPSQGGSGVVASELGLNLARHGYEVHFISSSMPWRLRRYRKNIIYHKVDMPQYPVFQQSPYTLSLASVMSDTAIRYNLDILHVHYAIPHAASAFLAQQMVGQEQLKVVTTLHGTDITLVGQEPSFFPLTRFLIQKSDAVTAVSEFLKQETLRIFDIDRAIETIPNFVDGRLFRPRADTSARREFAADDEILFFHASNFRPVKNVSAVIKVFAGISDKVKARLLLVGDGPEMVTIQEMTQALNLSDKVQFMGAMEDMAAILPQADILLLPSLHESFGLVTLEAIACGVVPIATSRGGSSDFIQHGSNGFLCDPHDIELMVKYALQLSLDKDLREHMAEEGRRVASGDFGVSCVLKKYMELYDRLLGN